MDNNVYEQENQNQNPGAEQPHNPDYQQAYNQGYGQPYNPNCQQAYNQGYQQSYNPNYQQQYYPQDNGLEEPVSFGDWMLSMLILMIPCVNLVMMFVWAFGSGTKKSKSNYFKASLVWAIIWSVILILMVIGFGAMIVSIATYY